MVGAFSDLYTNVVIAVVMVMPVSSVCLSEIYVKTELRKGIKVL